MANFTFVDLFAGIGGFRLALESLGGSCIGFSEIAPDAINTYCANFKEAQEANFGDITKLKDLPEHDFMTAGVPCQSWSIAGKNLGFDDDRGQLWNDALYLLNKVRPKAFIFENVKGLADPRNQNALEYILKRISEAGYHAKKYVLNSYDYGVPQTRIRIYIIGFKEKKYLDRLTLPSPQPGKIHLSDVLDDDTLEKNDSFNANFSEQKAKWSLSCNNKGFNDYFLFNDLRNGETTIHSWDIIDTTDREKDICYLLLNNRRKRKYGILDGNPLSLKHFQDLDHSISQEELDRLVNKQILKKVDYLYLVKGKTDNISLQAKMVLDTAKDGIIHISEVKNNRELKKNKVNVMEMLGLLKEANVITCIETRYDFKNTKISTGLDGINRIILPSCKIYPTLVASDTNDFIATKMIKGETLNEYKKNFMNVIYRKGGFRKITKSEACRIQGFPDHYLLPPTRARWMKLIGNSVAVPIVKMLAKAIVDTGVFNGQSRIHLTRHNQQQLGMFDCLPNEVALINH